jgi:hypothetical protein
MNDIDRRQYEEAYMQIQHELEYELYCKEEKQDVL